MLNKDKSYKIAITIVGTIFVIGIGLILFQLVQYYKADYIQDKAYEIVQLAEIRHQNMQTQAEANNPITPNTPSSLDAAQPGPLDQFIKSVDTMEENAQFLLQLDYSSMQQENEDVMGWIYIPNSPVSYPLLRSKDNSDYLKRAWDGSYNIAGSIFLECQNHDDFLDFNTIIYGHHMKSGSHFAAIINYWAQDYSNKHPFIYIVSGNMVRCYEVFAAHTASIDSDAYRLYFPDEDAKRKAIDFYMENSVLEKKIVPTTEDYILTLSTCVGTGNYNNRWVVQARLNAIYEANVAPEAAQ